MGTKVGTAVLELTTDQTLLIKGLAQAKKETDSFGGMLGPLKGQLAAAFSVGALVAFGQELLDTADNLVKLSDKTGISVEGIQELDFIAKQSGNTLEQVTSAISQMQKRLANGDDSAVGALRKLGISQQQFMALSPEEQFFAIAREVAKIESPMQRVKVATDLFGKSGAEVIPTLIAEIDKLRGSVTTMSDHTARAFDDIGDRLDAMKGRFQNVVAASLVSVFDAFSESDAFFDTLIKTGSVALAAQAASAVATAHDKVQSALASLRKDGLEPTASHYDSLRMAVSHNTEEQQRQIDTTQAVSKRVAELKGAVSTLTPEQKKWIDQLSNLGESQADIAKLTGLSSDAIAQYVKGQKSAAERDKQAEDAKKKLADQQKSQNDQLSRQFAGLQNVSGVIQKVTDLEGDHADQLDVTEAAYNLLSTAIDEFGLVTDEFEASVRKTNYALKALRGEMKSLGDGLPPVVKGMDDLGAATEKAGKKSDESKSAHQRYASALIAAFDGASRAAEMNGDRTTAAVMAIAGAVTKAFTESGTGIEKVTTLLDGLSRAAEVSGHKTTAAVLTIASTTAKAFAEGGPVAGAIAAGLSIFSAFSDKLFKTESKKVNDLRDEYIAAGGGFTALAQKAVEAGTTIDELLKADTVKEYEAAVKKLNDAFAAQEQKLQEIAATKEELAGLEQQLADLQASQVPTWNDIESAANKYGIAIDALGPAIQQTKINEYATQAINAFDLLNRAGGDTNAILAGMADEISDIVNRSIKFGTTIPENMRPMIEQLAKNGQLLDENGRKIGDISGLKWGDPVKTEAQKIQDAVMKITEKIGELVDKLEKLVNPSKESADKVREQWRKAPWEDWPQPEWPDGSGGPGGAGGPREMAEGGMGVVTRPTLFLAGEAGREEYAFSGAGRSFGGSLGGGITVTVPVSIDGREVARAVVPVLPGELSRLGLS